MIRRNRFRVQAVVAVGWLLSAGCATVTMTAANSINPVMFGPAKTFPTGTVTRELPPIPGGTAFRHKETYSGGAVIGYGGSASYWSSSTNPAADDESGPDWSANQVSGWIDQLWLDWKVFRATGETPDRRVDLTSIRCGGFNCYFLFGILVENGCLVEGVVPSAE